MKLSDEIYELFRREGLLLLGAVPLEYDEDAGRFRRWVADGNHASMAYLEANMSLRCDPQGFFKGAKTALVFGFPYHHDSLERSKPKVARYAQYKDYHRFMKKKAGEVLQGLKSMVPSELNVEARIFVDSAPILERALAARTTHGFIGKNTLYIHPQFGSFLLLGEIISNVPFEGSRKMEVDPSYRGEMGGCGTCRRCQVHCPTGALSKDFQLDARRCLSYWTIEHRGPIPEEFWPYLGEYLFGCDRCQDVCPYNRSVPEWQAAEGKVLLKSPMKTLSLFDVATMSPAQYADWFGGTPMTRAKIFGLRRNALIAMWALHDEKIGAAMAKVGPDDHKTLRDTVESLIRLRKRN